jgi:hypothetical protein
MKHPVIKIIFASFLFSASGLAVPPPPAIQYVGSNSINPSHDAKVLADWYQKFGVDDLQAYNGGYFGSFKTPPAPIYLGIHPKKADAPQKSSTSVAFVFRVNDYNGYVSKLEKQGLKPHEIQSDAEGHFATYRDPDGNEMTVWGD